MHWPGRPIHLLRFSIASGTNHQQRGGVQPLLAPLTLRVVAAVANVPDSTVKTILLMKVVMPAVTMLPLLRPATIR